MILQEFPHEAARRECAKLYMAALNGDWNSVKDMDDIQRIISDKGETTLHIAVAANQKKFVQNLLNEMEPDKLEAENKNGINAFTYAAATGKLDIVKAMLHKNPNLRGTLKPLLMATLFGHNEMVEHLFSLSGFDKWNTTDKDELFVACASNGMYGKHKFLLFGLSFHLSLHGLISHS